ncbi:DUF6603 domain-containing protein [Nocardia cyriacigeorgica]|uniref:DUF6603 domain-containing protein n=1 Tax=Nocardia cyriacigeorgica TaxID=135487 RepID=UPI0013CFFD2F|nr:DUF6603 domain-containing protein [Nocardia cyriacigeorgica]NEW28854.1 hypothetical protein [Nocardia cyriacigeorgica]
MGPFSTYAVQIRTVLGQVAGPQAAAALDQLDTAAAGVDLALAPGTSTQQWTQAVAAWRTAQSGLLPYLPEFLMAGLPKIPGLDLLADAVRWDSPDGMSGTLPVGPVTLGVATSSSVATPPVAEPAAVIGPLRPESLSARIAPPFGAAAAAGGGAIVRAGADSFGGLLQLPLGPLQIDASAILQRLPDGTMSFFAVMGAQFTPPLQLSFGFSLDRVGGVLGVNRTAHIDALSAAVRTGAAGDLLFAVRPPASPGALAATANSLFPARPGCFLIGPAAKLSWLSFGAEGSLLGVDLGVIIEIPAVKVVLVGVARASIPRLTHLLNLRLDVLGVIDPGQRLVAVDASLVDSHAFGVLDLFGDAAMRVCWGTRPYAVLSVGGFYPGFDPEPAKLPALRRVGVAMQQPLGIIELRAEGYLAVTTNTVQLGGRFDVRIRAGLEAHGFLQVDALVQFRPFAFAAACSAGFDVSVSDFTFGGVRLDGVLSGPAPLTLRGSLTIETFLFDFSWSETITISGGTPDSAPSVGFDDVVKAELSDAHNLTAEHTTDPDVVLEPRPGTAGRALVPPTGALRFEQRRFPFGVPIDRVDGRPLGGTRRADPTSAGTPVTSMFAPGSFLSLSQSEALTKPAFEPLVSGVILAFSAKPGSAPDIVPDNRSVRQIVLYQGLEVSNLASLTRLLLADTVAIIAASQAPPALGSDTALITARSERWVSVPGDPPTPRDSATAAYRYSASWVGGYAVPETDLIDPVDLTGVGV